MRFWTRSLALSALCLLSPVAAFEKTQILFLLKSQEVDKAFAIYQQMAGGQHDYDLLEQMASILLQQGITHSDPEVQLLTMYGTSISHYQCPLFILEEGLLSQNPYVQASAIQTLAQMSDDGVDELIIKAMQSPYLMIRIQAAHALSQRGFKRAVGPIESLMQKLPGGAWVFFPDLYALLGDRHSIAILKSLTHHPVREVRLSSIFSAAKYRRDELLPAIRSMATHADYSEQEMAAFALGTFNDIASKETLIHLKESKDPSVALGAAHALKHLGDSQAIQLILSFAQKKNPFAIALLGKYDEGKALLYELLQDRDPHIRLNATLALLKRKDSAAVSTLCDFLLLDHRDVGFLPCFSAGHTQVAWRCIPLAYAKAKNEGSEILSVSMALRGEMLTDCLELDEALFLMIARKVFENKQLDLIPLLIQLLQNLDSPSARKLLQEQAQKSHSPFISAYCNLALYRMKDPHFDEKKLFAWLTEQSDHHLIQFRPKESTKKSEQPNLAYQLTPEETSKLLIEGYQALAERRDPKAIDALITAMAIGNPKNRYALAGLLLFAIQ